MTILPMKTTEKPKYLAKTLTVLIALAFILWAAPLFFNTVMDRLDNQKEARAGYMYETYGDLYNN